MKSVIGLYRNAFGGISREVWLLSVMQFINRSGTMVVPFLSVYLHEELAFNYSQVGAVMGCFGAGSLLGVYSGGKLVDKLGFYGVMLSSLITGGVMFLLLSHIRDFAILCGGMFLLSALAEAFRPAGMVAISQFSKPENYTRSLALYRLAMNLGFSIGPAVGGFLATISYTLIFHVDGVSSIIAGLMAFLFIRPGKKPVSTTAEKTTEHMGSVFKDKVYMLFLIVGLLYAITFFQFFSIMPLFYKHEAGLNEANIGWLLTLNGVIVATIEMVMIYKIEKKFKPLKLVTVGTILIVFSYLWLLADSSIPSLIFLMVVVSFSEMLAIPFMNTFMNQRAPAARKGQYASLYVMSWSMAQIIIPILATQVIGHLGYPALWIVLATITVITILLIRKLQSMLTESDLKHQE